MKKIAAVVLAVSLWATAAAGQQARIEVLLPTGAAEPADPELKNLRWYKYDTRFFTFLSIDRQQGQYLEESADKIKSWACTRWGLPDTPFGREVRVMCVPDRVMYKKLFTMDDSLVEVRDKMIAIWVVLDDKPSRTIPGPLTEVILCEYEKANGTKLGWWVHRGMARLNGPLADVRSDMSYLSPLVVAGQVFDAKFILGTTETDYRKLAADKKSLFDRQAEAMLLLVRKEYGAKKYQSFALGQGDPENLVRLALGFQSVAHFDAAYRRYLADLTGDVVKSRTPDAYFDIIPEPTKKK